MQDGLPNSPTERNVSAPESALAGDTTSASAQSPSAVPWWQSRTILGILLSVAAPLLRKLSIDPQDPALIDTVASLVSVIGGALAIYGRVKATRPISSGVAPRISAAALLLLAFSALAALYLSGCSTSGINQEFRRNVSAVEGNASVTNDEVHHTTTGTVGTRVEFRNPDKEGLAK